MTGPLNHFCCGRKVPLCLPGFMLCDATVVLLSLHVEGDCATNPGTVVQDRALAARASMYQKEVIPDLLVV